MKRFTLLAALSLASLGYVSPAATLRTTEDVKAPPAPIDGVSVERTGYLSTTRVWEQVLLPLLSTFDFLDTTSLNQADGEAELVQLAANATIDWDAAIDQITGSDPSTQNEIDTESQLDKRHLTCGMHVVIESPCKTMYACNFACILGYKGFPWRTCKYHLLNGKCPQGLQGYGSLKPEPPMQDYQNAPPQNNYYDEDPWRDGMGYNEDGSMKYPDLPYEFTQAIPPELE